MMKILLSNDDGFIAPGINLLREALIQNAEVLTVTPDRDRSASSNSLTLDRPLRLTERGENFYSSNGTPTDCVHLALTGLYKKSPPDLVISGINAGANMGDDVIYSGTVAAAMEGRNLGLPAIAVSMTSFNPEHYASGVQAVLSLLKDLPNLTFVQDDNVATILNVNVPDIPWSEIKGFKATRLGKRHAAEPIIKDKDEHKLYVLFLKNGYYYLKPVSLNDGSTSVSFKLGYRYVENVKVENGFVYYIYRPYESAQKKYLYREIIRTK